ncbi:MAG: hypothetical protein COB79_00595 [Zetaproteobacteria bacterium]|nr:MAG: hypothetical protein COB79_00595 [Zetaproteobacteria bacterium]
MFRIVRHLMMMLLLLGITMPAQAEETNHDIMFTDLNLNVELLDSSLWVADNRQPTSTTVVPNIPDSAFKKPMFTENDLHMYLGLASMALGVLTAVSADGASGDPDLLNTVHYKASKGAWQLGAAAVGTGLWAHWDDFHLEDGLLDRDNLHVILGTLGVIGYYLAVKDAVDEYNSLGFPSEDHSNAGMLGGAAMLTAIVITW